MSRIGNFLAIVLTSLLIVGCSGEDETESSSPEMFPEIFQSFSSAAKITLHQ